MVQGSIPALPIPHNNNKKKKKRKEKKNSGWVTPALKA
jgi:hypothetical protein